MYRWISIYALTLTACGVIDEKPSVSEQSAPIIGGDETVDVPGIVVVQLDNGDYCSGTVVSPRVVATSAACLDGQTDVAVSQTFASQQIPALETYFEEGHSITQDPVGLILLEGEAPVAQVELYTGAMTEDDPIELAGWHGETLRVAATNVNSLNENLLNYGEKTTIAVCFGDFGGPAFVTKNGKKSVAAIHVGTFNVDGNCSNGLGARMDANAAYISGFVESVDPTPADPPVIEIIRPLPDQVVGTSFNAEAAVTEESLATLELWIDGSPYDIDFDINLPPFIARVDELSTGPHELTFVARDVHGASAEQSVTITVDPLCADCDGVDDDGGSGGCSTTSTQGQFTGLVLLLGLGLLHTRRRRGELRMAARGHRACKLRG